MTGVGVDVTDDECEDEAGIVDDAVDELTGVSTVELVVELKLDVVLLAGVDGTANDDEADGTIIVSDVPASYDT